MIELLGCGGLRYCRGSGRVHRVAVGAGACSEYIPQAIAQGSKWTEVVTNNWNPEAAFP